MSPTIRTNLAHSPRLPLGGCMPALALLFAVAACESDSDHQALDASENPSEPTEAGADGGVEDDGGLEDADVDGEIDADPEAGEAGAVTEAGPEGGPEPDSSTTGKTCETADDCDDLTFCNGQERCVEDPETGEKTCQPALRPACPPEHLPCDEQARECNCLDPDHDKDGVVAEVCGGEDCDDADGRCYKGAREICDPEHRNEDCDVKTVGKQDSDKDGFDDHMCRNQDPDTGEWHEGEDCDDTNDEVNPDWLEICDYIDNNCNGWVDEERLEDGSWAPEHGGQRNDFVPDLDGDGRGATGVEPERHCIYDAPRRFVLATDPSDCNDADPTVYKDAPEPCDGLDNNCDGTVDGERELVGAPEFTGTTIACVGGTWIIPPGGCPDDSLWCPGDPVALGCARDGRRLSSCHACGTSCQFSCGRDGCDEIEQLAPGALHTCARTKEGLVACWGRGAHGRLGDDAAVSRTTASRVVNLGAASLIAAGTEHSCAVTGSERQLWCWGHNDQGQLGTTDTPDVNQTEVPAPVLDIQDAFLTDVISVDGGLAHTCAVKSSGALLCFGSVHRLGIGVVDNPAQEKPWRLATPVVRMYYDELLGFPVSEEVQNAVEVVTGVDHSCARLRDGTVGCWGDNTQGQLGDGSSLPYAASFQAVPGLTNVESLSAGDSHTCALSDGKVLCWGGNTNLQLGRVSGPDNRVPATVTLSERIVQIAAGRGFTCALATSGRVACWGSAAVLGVEQPGSAASAMPLWLPFSDVIALSSKAGQEHVCARTTTSASCWGGNTYGQLGIGTQERPRTAKVTVSPLSGSLP